MATTVMIAPLAVLAGCAAVERTFCRSGPLPPNVNVGLLLMVIPTMAMLALSMVGMLFGTAGMIARPRGADYAMVGLLVNSSILVSIVCSLMGY